MTQRGDVARALNELTSEIRVRLDHEVYPDVHRRAREAVADPSEDNVWALLARVEARVRSDVQPRIRRLAADLSATLAGAAS